MRPPAYRGDLGRRRRHARQAGHEHRHPHLDAFKRGRRAYLGERARAGHADAELLAQLAAQACERRLARIGLPARQVEDLGRWALAD
jgi:hypothetical protein